MATPAPGSHAAVRLGCKCDMLVNQLGLGVGPSNSMRHYMLNPECKIHDHTTTYIAPPSGDIEAIRRRAQQQRDRLLRDVAQRAGERRPLENYQFGRRVASSRSGLPLGTRPDRTDYERS